jgi:hypothetical protein
VNWDGEWVLRLRCDVLSVATTFALELPGGQGRTDPRQQSRARTLLHNEPMASLTARQPPLTINASNILWDGWTTCHAIRDLIFIESWQ